MKDRKNKILELLTSHGKMEVATLSDQLHAQAVRDMAHQAEKVIVLTESEKFEKHGTVPLNITKLISCVITDNQISAHAQAQLAEQSIDVIRSAP